MTESSAPLIVHVVYRFDVGGLENGLVNLINRSPASEFRHAVVALTECAPAFCRRITRGDVEFVSLGKPEGHGIRIFRPFWKLMRKWNPAIVHTRNLAALEMQVPAWAARVPIRIHGEHGRDLSDPDGTSPKYRWVRRALSPFVTHYVALSADLEQYLTQSVGIAPRRVTRICNGVDDERFTPEPRGGADAQQRAASTVLIGTVGRLEGVKGQRVLVAAVRRLTEIVPDARVRVRVQIVGDGPARAEIERGIEELGVGDMIDLPGSREDIPDLMKQFDIFVLPSLAEGVSNTILEAMATGLPVVATAVGGNPELVADGASGTLVPADDPDALAAALARYVESAELRARHGMHGRQRVEAGFSLSGMVERYRSLYRSVIDGRLPASGAA